MEHLYGLDVAVGLVVLPFRRLHRDLFPRLVPTYSVASRCVP